MKTSTLFEAVVALTENPELLDGDGHAVLAPDYYTKLGIPSEFLDGLEKTIKSNFKDHKQTIYVNGEAVKSIKGIYNLDFLYRVASSLGVKHDAMNKYGRGSQAGVICSAVKDALPRLRIKLAHSF
tara:strand:+ start:533 stop:910 length:378 start_codon:yes stop_codon:yes gene_type:complete